MENEEQRGPSVLTGVGTLPFQQASQAWVLGEMIFGLRSSKDPTIDLTNPLRLIELPCSLIDAHRDIYRQAKQ